MLNLRGKPITAGKAFLIFAAIAVLAGICVFMVTFTPALFQPGDNCGYMSLAIAFSQGRGFIDPALPGSFDFLWWPPGFPMFIALFYSIAGARWVLLKVLILVLLYVSLVLYAGYIYEREKRIVKVSLLLCALCVSSGIHLLSSYLYSETFFIVCTMLFFVLWRRWEHSLSKVKIVLLSLFALYCSLVRLVGIGLPAALFVYLFFFPKKTGFPRYFGFIPLVLVMLYAYCALFVPGCYIGSFRSTARIHPGFKSVQVQGSREEKTALRDKVKPAIERSLNSVRGFTCTLIPQALIRTTYDSHPMNRIKMAFMGMVTLITIIGWIATLREYRLMNIFTLMEFLILLLYGPLYVRIVVPLIPFLMLYFYSGIERGLQVFIKRRNFLNAAVIAVWVAVIADNASRSFTDPRRTMPPEFGDRRYQECLSWAINKTKPGDIVISQIHSYLYLMRGPYCLPYFYIRTPEEFVSYCDEHHVDYVMVSPFYHRPHDSYMDQVRKAEKLYPGKFKKVFGEEGDASYILAYRKDDRQRNRN